MPPICVLWYLSVQNFVWHLWRIWFVTETSYLLITTAIRSGRRPESKWHCACADFTETVKRNPQTVFRENESTKFGGPKWSRDEFTNQQPGFRETGSPTNQRRAGTVGEHSRNPPSVETSIGFKPWCLTLRIGFSSTSMPRRESRTWREYCSISV